MDMNTLRSLSLACRHSAMPRLITLLLPWPALATVLALLANIKTLIQLPRRRSVYMHERLFVPRIIFAMGLLVVGGAERPAHGKPINQNFTFDLSLGSVIGGFVDPATGQPIEEYQGTVAYPTFTPTLSPGDTYRLRVRFPNREAIQLIGGAAKQGIGVFLFDSNNVTRYNFAANETFTFNGVRGDLQMNPLAIYTTGFGGLPFSDTELNLTSSQFSFRGFTFTFTPSQYDLIRGNGQLNTLKIAFGSDEIQIVCRAPRGARIPCSAPEPTTLSLLGLGLAGICFMRRRRGT
jgi:PEP-CTERM motif